MLTLSVKKANERTECFSYDVCSADFKVNMFTPLSDATTYSQIKQAVMIVISPEWLINDKVIIIITKVSIKTAYMILGYSCKQGNAVFTLDISMIHEH